MSFFSYLGHGFKLCLFDKQAVQDIVNDPEHKKNALILTTLTSLIGALVITGLLWFIINTPSSLLGELAGSIITNNYLPFIGLGIFAAIWLFTLIGAGFTHLIAHMLHGQASIFQYYSIWVVYGLWIGVVSGLLIPITFIPILGSLVSLAYSIYGIIVGVFALRETYHFSTGRAIGVFAIIFALTFVIVFIITIIGYMSIFSLAQRAYLS